MKIFKYSLILVVSLIISIIAFVLISQQMFDPNKLPHNYGKIDSKLFAKEGKKQPLLVYFGGSEGGNSMTKEHHIIERKMYTDKGYAMLAIGYFGMEGIPKDLDRISLNAIYEEIKRVQTNPKVDATCVAVMGGSKGAELVLALASKYQDINAVVSFAGSHVSFNSTSMAADARTPSFNYNNLPLPYVTVPKKAIPYLLIGDLRRAHELALADTSAVEAAVIAVENINGPILLLSGENDQVWPSAEMSVKVINRLINKGFSYPYQHIMVPNGNHSQPQSDYHPQVIEFLDKNFKPTCDSSRAILT
jgi:dipeptidyl aminopeptidase/acylaminoacyl peptidase